MKRAAVIIGIGGACFFYLYVCLEVRLESERVDGIVSSESYIDIGFEAFKVGASAYFHYYKKKKRKEKEDKICCTFKGNYLATLRGIKYQLDNQ